MHNVYILHGKCDTYNQNNKYIYLWAIKWKGEKCANKTQNIVRWWIQ